MLLAPHAIALGEVLTIVGAIITLVIVAAGIYAVFKSSAADARIKRLQDERDDYLSRLNYIEPKFVEAQQQNKLLRELHNPTSQLESMAHTGEGVERKVDEILDVLENQERTLQSIDSRLHGGTAT